MLYTGSKWSRSVLNQSKRSLYLLVWMVLAVGAQRSCGQQKQEMQRQTNEKIRKLGALARAEPMDATIRSGDLLHIDLLDVSEPSRDVRVSELGQFSYPLIPAEIQASGLTFQLVAQLLIENVLVLHPQVSVPIKEQVSHPVSVTGAVIKPMVYQVVHPTTLLEVLAQAGGIAETAGNVAIITRGGHPAIGAHTNG
jgi:protein involved in polysaccharide export with SLBB domain